MNGRRIKGVTMDEIQKILIKAGRKDLAQKYYEKTAAEQEMKFGDIVYVGTDKAVYISKDEHASTSSGKKLDEPVYLLVFQDEPWKVQRVKQTEVRKKLN